MRIDRTYSSLALAGPGLIVLVLLSGCKPVGPNYSTPAYQAPAAYKELGASAIVPPPAPKDGAWSTATPIDDQARGKWWEVYQDSRLNELEEELTKANYDLKQANEVYLASHDQARAARASLFPTISAGPSIGRTNLSANRPETSSYTHYNDFALGGQASWEPDFWGRIHRSVEAAHATAQASAADLATLNLSLHAELASDYFSLRGLDSQVKMMTATVANLQSQLELTEQRLAGGVSTEADVELARTQLETVRAQLVDLSASRALLEHAIATLTGQNAAGFALAPAPLEQALPKIPVGVPSELLERRPDIAAAERRVAAANEQIGIAQSAYYPDIALSASGGFESTHSGTWLVGPSEFWALGASATELLFDGGKRRALTDQARHNYQAQTDAYRSTVLNAFNGVEDQLSTLRVLEEEAGVEQKAVDSAQRSLELSNQRYKGGVTNYLEVLTTESALLDNQRTAIGITTRQFVASVGLVRALGGGWRTQQLPR
jgi:NodT family efflux transporter outer membrane factor (OMF) lipoprotein